MKWTIKTENFNSMGLIKGDTKEEAIENFLKRYPEYKDKDIEVYPTKRYSYSTTGYGVFSLMGEFYASGRIEIYDGESESGFAISEGKYWVPIQEEGKVRDFFDNLETTLPLEIRLGHFEECQKAVSEKLDIPVDKLHDKDVVKEYWTKKHQEYLDGLDPEERKRLEEKFGTKIK